MMFKDRKYKKIKERKKININNCKDWHSFYTLESLPFCFVVIIVTIRIIVVETHNHYEQSFLSPKNISIAFDIYIYI